jgi:alpha-L-fucosidase
MHVHFWPGDYVAISGLKVKVKSAHLVKTKGEVKFTQDEFQTKFTGLPQSAPDYPVTTIAIECDGVPAQDTDFVRRNKPRDGV